MIVSSMSRRRPAWSLFTLVCLLMMLVGCGQPDLAPSPVPTVVQQSGAEGTSTPTPLPAEFDPQYWSTPSAQDLTEVALVQADLQREQDYWATSDALPPGPAFSDPLPTDYIPPTAILPVGIQPRRACVPPEGDPEFDVVNCWRTRTATLEWDLDAGSQIGGGGALRLYTRTLELDELEWQVGNHIYPVPQPVAKLTITSVTFPQVLVQANDGTEFVFNLETQQWEDPATFPTPAPTSTAPTDTPTPQTGPTDTPTPTATPASGGGGEPVIARINAGGPAVATGGIAWSADQLFSGGKQWSNPIVTAIANTDDDVLYRTEHSATGSGSARSTTPFPRPLVQRIACACTSPRSTGAHRAAESARRASASSA